MRGPEQPSLSVNVPQIARPQSFSLTASNFDQFVSHISNLGAISKGPITLDLRQMAFIDLFSMVGIAFVCHDLQYQTRLPVRLELSEDGACGFLPRVGFFDILPEHPAPIIDFPPARIEFLRLYHGANPGLLELTRIDSNQAIEAILDKFIAMLRHRLKYPKDEANDLAIMLSELCHNIIDHHPDPSRAGGVAAMQVHDGQGGRFLQVVVADRGDGIRRTLARNTAFASLTSDTEAIDQSVQLGVSEYEERTRGNGLYHLLRLTSQHKGTIHIRSGAGKMYYRADRAAPQLFAVAPLTGTQFALAFPVKNR